MLHRRGSNARPDLIDQEAEARSARHLAQREARKSAEKHEKEDLIAPAPTIEWGQKGVGALLEEEQFGVSTGSPDGRRKELEAAANMRATADKKSPVVLDKGKRPQGPVSTGWAPVARASSDAPEAYPVSQSASQTIAILREALQAERRATEEAEERSRLLMSEKDALLKQLRECQDKLLLSVTNMAIS